jgi:autotransporter-associated beta strand protein
MGDGRTSKTLSSQRNRLRHGGSSRRAGLWLLCAGLLAPGLVAAQGGQGGNGAEYFGVGPAGGATNLATPGGAGAAGPDGGLQGGGGGGAGVTGGAGGAGSAHGGPGAAGGLGGATPGAAGQPGADAANNLAGGGGGGGGAHGWVGPGLPSAAVTGGAGGAGGSVPLQIINVWQGGGGGGGAGGHGAVITGTGNLGTLTGSVTGGAGGAGGFASPGGGEGAGGAGLVFTQPGVTARLDGDVSGGGRSGAAIIGSGLTLTINGRVSGGLTEFQAFAAPSMVLGEGTSRLTFGPQASVTGIIETRGALELSVSEGTLSLGGVGDGVISGPGSVRIWQGTVMYAGGSRYTGGTTIDSAGTLILGAGPFAGRVAQPFGQNSANLPGDVVNNGTLVFAGYWHVIEDVISGTGSVEASTADRLILARANTYSGNTTIRRNTLSLQGAGTMGDGTGRVIIGSAGVLDISGAGSEAGRRINSLEGEGVVRLGSATLTLGAAGGNSNFAGRITDMPDSFPSFAGGGLTIAGGRTVLTGDNNYSGPTRIQAGATLQIGDGGTTGTLGTGTLPGPPIPGWRTPGPGPVINEGTLIFNRAGSLTVGHAISGTGSLVQDGPGTLILTGDNTFSGTTRIAPGATLQVGNGGTAGSLGGATPGPVINHGMLVFNRAGTLTVANAISGPGGLVQNGPGNLILTGANTYTGVTQVNGGTLSVNGSLDARSVVVLEGGTLGGTGTLPGLVVPSGSTLAPGNSIGTIRIGGDLTLAAGSITSIEVQGDTADRIQVSGAARLGGVLQLVPLGGRYSFGTPYIILQAASVTGQFTAINTAGSFGAGVVPQVSATPTELRLTLAPSLLAAAGGAASGVANGAASGGEGAVRLFGQNVVATAAALDSAVRAGGNLSPFFDVYNQPAGSIGAAINQLSGEVATASIAMGQAAGAQFLATVLDPLGWGREAILGGRLRLGEDARAGKRHAVWGTATGVYNRTSGDAADGTAARTTRSSGFVLGLDLLQGAQSLAGIAVAVGESNASLSNGLGQSRGNYGQIGAYGSTRLGSVTLAGAGAFTFLDVDTRRTIYVLGNDRQSGGSGVQVYSLRMEARQDGIAAFGLRALPVAALQLQSVDNPSYTEQSMTTGNAYGLTVAARTNTTLRSELGGQVQGETQWAGRRVQGFARAAWAHYLQRDASMNMAFTSLPAAGFTLRGARPDTNAALVSLGLETEIMGGVTLGARLDGEWSGNMNQVAGTARLRYLF